MKKKQKRDVDVLAMMRKRGDIDAAEYEGGRQFQQQFADARCGGAGSIDYEKVSSGGSNSASSPTETAVMRGQSVFRAIDRLGGMGSPCGKAAWKVLGMGMNIAEWASSEGYERSEAKGILLACVSILARHYGYA
ncbi:MAG: hypothetical protein J5855_02910 [Mailhella sp.]|nr:hypothetical protein [Mailhella sp.]